MEPVRSITSVIWTLAYLASAVAETFNVLNAGRMPIKYVFTVEVAETVSSVLPRLSVGQVVPVPQDVPLVQELPQTVITGVPTTSRLVFP
jgi:hypothetical protein